MHLLPKRMMVLVVAVVLAAGCGEGVIAGAGGAVSSSTPEATEAGLQILEAGGNAVDAAVAVQFALTVTEPAGSGLFGQTVMLVHPPDVEPFVIHGTSYAPAGTPADATADDVVGRRASTVPSTPRVLEYAWREYGSGQISWAQLLEPAIRYAEEGFVMDTFRHWARDRLTAELAADPATAALFLTVDGSVPPVGTVFRQPEVARTLRRLAEAGAEDFYSGDIAQAIARDMEANGGWLTLEDLRSFPDPPTVPAVHGTYRGADVYTLPPPFGGWVVLQGLNLLEQEDAPSFPGQRERWTLWMAEALRLAHTSRQQEPVQDLVNYDAAIAERIDKGVAAELWATGRGGRSGETTHFSVVDGDGLGVSATASINAFYGARVAHPELGLLYNDYMREFVLDDPQHTYALRAGAMPYSSMSATSVARDGNLELLVGSPGSARIISAVIQVVSHHLDQGMDIMDAVAVPRVHVVPQYDLYLEADLAAGPVLERSEAMGFTFHEPPTQSPKGGALSPYFGGVHAVARHGQVWAGGADPRRDGAVGLAR